MNEAEHINTVSGSVHGQVLQARTVTADTIVLHAPDHRMPVPRQLPPPARTWVDRDDELERLDRLLATAGPTRVVVTGLGGVGKTGLAVRWLDAHHERHPDGVLARRPQRLERSPATDHTAGPRRMASSARCRRRRPAGRGTGAGRAVSDGHLGQGGGRAGRQRPLRRAGAALVPATARGTILVTSRHRLAGLALAGFRHLDLECFPVATGAALLAGLLDEDRQPLSEDLLCDLATRCHGHPLALAIAGAHLATHPRRDPARLITHLTHLTAASAALDPHELAVEGVLQMTYEDLDATTARLYRGLTEHPGAEFTAEPLAAGLDMPITEGERGLGRLVEANLVTETGDERYRP